MGGAGTSGKGARGPAAPADFGEAAEKEAISIDRRGDAIMLARRLWQNSGASPLPLRPAPVPALVCAGSSCAFHKKRSRRLAGARLKF